MNPSEVDAGCAYVVISHYDTHSAVPATSLYIVVVCGSHQDRFSAHTDL